MALQCCRLSWKTRFVQTACIALLQLLRGIEKSPGDKRRNEVRDTWSDTRSDVITRWVMTCCEKCWENWI